MRAFWLHPSSLHCSCRPSPLLITCPHPPSLRTLGFQFPLLFFFVHTSVQEVLWVCTAAAQPFWTWSVLTFGTKAAERLCNVWSIGFPNGCSIWCLDLRMFVTKWNKKSSVQAVVAVVSTCFLRLKLKGVLFVLRPQTSGWVIHKARRTVPATSDRHRGAALSTCERWSPIILNNFFSPFSISKRQYQAYVFRNHLATGYRWCHPLVKRPPILYLITDALSSRWRPSALFDVKFFCWTIRNVRLPAHSLACMINGLWLTADL